MSEQGEEVVLGPTGPTDVSEQENVGSTASYGSSGNTASYGSSGNTASYVSGSTSSSGPSGATASGSEAKLTDVPITSENVALNVLVSFVNLAQRRGAFSIDEAGKIWECIKKFQRSE